MNSSAVSMMLTKGIMKSPILMWGLGLVSMLFFTYFGFISWREYSRFPAEPVHITLIEESSVAAKNKAWVIIDDIQWDCDHIFYKDVDANTHTDVVFSDKSNSIWGYAFFSSKMTCDELVQEEAVGVLDFANDKKRADLIENGFDVSKHEANGRFLSLCTHCGKGNSLLGIILSGIMIIIGALLVMVANRIQHKNRLATRRVYYKRKSA
jgi:hypothetical protein